MGSRRLTLVFLSFFVLGAAALFNLKDEKESQQPIPARVPANDRSPNTESSQSPTVVTQAPTFRRKLIKPTAPAQSRVQWPGNSELAEFSYNTPNSAWKLWRGMKAQYPTDKIEQSPLQVAQFQILQEPGFDPSMLMQNFNLQEPLVLFEERLKTTGVLTGTFEIHLGSNTRWSDLESQHSLRLIQGFQDLNLFYATASQDRFNLVALFEGLKSDPRVKLVNLEILSRQYDQK